MADHKTRPTVEGQAVALLDEALQRRPNLFADPLWSKLPERTTAGWLGTPGDQRWSFVNMSGSTVLGALDATYGVLSIPFSMTAQDVRLSPPHVKLDKTKTYTWSVELNKTETDLTGAGSMYLRGGTDQVRATDRNLPGVITTDLGGGWFRKTVTFGPADMDGTGDWAIFMVAFDWNQTRSGTLRYRNWMLHEGPEPQPWNSGSAARDYAEAAKAGMVAPGDVGLVTILANDSQTEAATHETYPFGISVLRVQANNANWPLSSAYLTVTTTKHPQTGHNAVTQEAQEWWAGNNRRWWRSPTTTGAWGPWIEVARDQTNIAYLPSSTPPAGWPTGVSIMDTGVNGATDGYPVSYAMVTTEKINTVRMMQTVYFKSAGPVRAWMRTPTNDGLGWTEWREVVWGDDPRLTDGMELLQRAEAAWLASAYTPGAARLRDITGHGHHALLGSAVGVDANDPLHLPFDDESYVYLPGENGNYLSTPDAPANRIVGSLDVRLRIRVAVPSTVQRLASKDSGAGSQRAWLFSFNTSGTLGFGRLPNGDSTDPATANSDVLPDMATTPRWVRVTYNAATGEIAFFHSLDGAVWTPAGTASSTPQPLFPSSHPLMVGSWAAGTATFAGRIYAAEIRNGINGPVVASFDASRSVAPHTTVSSETGETWTIVRSATGRKAALVDRPLFLFGTDDYLEVPHHPDLNFAANQPLSIAVAFRRYGSYSGAAETLIAKSDNWPHIAAGWMMNASVTDNAVGRIDQFTEGTPVRIDGTPNVAVMVRDANGVMCTVVNGVAGTTGVEPDAATSSSPLRIGMSSYAMAGQANMEFIGAAIFREALTTAELAALERFFLTAHVAPTPHAHTHAPDGSDPVPIPSKGVTLDKLPHVSFNNLILDPNFLLDPSPHDLSHPWINRFVTTLSRAGNSVIRITPAGSAAASIMRLNGGVIANVAANVQHFVPCNQGDRYYVEMYARAENAGLARGMQVRVQWFRYDGTYISQTAGTNVYPTSTAWAAFSATTAAAPAGTAFAAFDIAVSAASDGSWPTNPIYIDSAYAGKLWEAANIATGAVTNAKLASNAVTDVKVSASAAIAESKLALASDAVAGTASRRTLGTGALQAAAGNDVRFVEQLTGKIASHAPSTYPNGASICETGAFGGNGWPAAATTVLTIKAADTNARTTQYLTEKTTGRAWVRACSVDGTGWGDFIEQWNASTPFGISFKASTAVPSDWPTGHSSMAVPNNGVTNGYPADVGRVDTVRPPDGQGIPSQTFFEWSTAAKIRVWMRKANALSTGWRDWTKVATEDDMATVDAQLSLKADDLDVVKLVGNQEIEGTKLFTEKPWYSPPLNQGGPLAVEGAYAQFSDVWSDAAGRNMSQLPRGHVANVKASSAYVSISTEVTVLSLASLTLDSNRRYKITATAQDITQSVASDVFVMTVKLGSTSLDTSAGAALRWTPSVLALTNASGSHTINLTVRRSSGTGLATINAAQILVEDIGG